MRGALVISLCLALAAGGPLVHEVSAQGIDATVSAGVYIDPDGPPSGTVGPAIMAELGLPFVWGLEGRVLAGYARTDFPVGVDEVHRNTWILLLGLATPLARGSTTVSLGVAAGAIAEDDVSETDSGFRSSANWHETLSPGIDVSHELGGLELSFGVRAYVTDLIMGVLDPDESNVQTRFTTTVGIRLR